MSEQLATQVEEKVETKIEDVYPVAHPDRPQAACALLLDTSRSMRGEKIRGLEAGVKAYKEYLQNDEMAKDIVETCLITFDDEARMVQPFSNVEAMPEVQLEAKGWTAMGAAIEQAIEAIEARKQYYKDEGVDYYRPFLVLITDGGPTDMKDKTRYEAVKAKIQDGAKAKKFYPLFFGTKSANFEKLKDLVGPTGAVAGIDGVRFQEFFQWLSRSMTALTDSKPGETLTLVDPTAVTSENTNPFAFEV